MRRDQQLKRLDHHGRDFTAEVLTACHVGHIFYGATTEFSHGQATIFIQRGMSAIRQAVARCESFTGTGKVPVRTLRQRVAAENGT
jgi:hypothetical protein